MQKRQRLAAVKANERLDDISPPSSDDESDRCQEVVLEAAPEVAQVKKTKRKLTRAERYQVAKDEARAL